MASRHILFHGVKDLYCSNKQLSKARYSGPSIYFLHFNFFPNRDPCLDKGNDGACLIPIYTLSNIYIKYSPSIE